jgi:ABC-2 type transport system ATP-binding protein
MFEVRNIAFAYGPRPLLRDVSFVVSPGETVALVGANGAGKTTLLNVLSTLAVPDAGHVIADGREAFAHPLDYRRQLGYLPERLRLDTDLTVRAFLTYRAALKGEPRRRIRRRVGEALDLCRLSDCRETLIRSLSAGLQKRVALADALLLRPRVLLLDDLLSGLDGSLRDAAGEILSSAAAFSSVIVTGHETAELARWATRFLVLRDGVVGATVEAAGADPAAVCARVTAALEGERV